MTEQLPTINIKGKDYVQVKDRILYFNQEYPNGSISTELVSPVESKTVVVKATVIPDVKNPERKFCDYSQAVIGQGMVNQTAAMENASTSAVGRALGFMGIGIIESVASADEITKAISQTPQDSNEITREPVEQVGIKHCSEHDTDMKEKISKNTGKPYFSHSRKDENGNWETCFGSGYKAFSQ